MKAILNFQGFTRMIDLPRFTPEYRVPVSVPLDYRVSNYLDTTPDTSQTPLIIFRFSHKLSVMDEEVLYYRGELSL